MADKILDVIEGPEDLKRLSQDELLKLADEIRDLIIKTTSVTGGHLASSLGAVELTIALHLTLDTPRDKVIWDVGHQCYAHKILTGRKDRFLSLRQYDGISGFPRRTESEYDVVDAGHAGSSISHALGIAIGRDLAGEDYAVAAVIGDGSMTSGVAYEAMNQVGQNLDSNLIIILNDNDMSISKNVGGVAKYLSKVRIKPGYTHLKEEVGGALHRISGIGDTLLKSAKHFKDSVTHAFLPGVLFETLGLKYVGPIDGHDIQELSEAIGQARQVKAPVLLHVITQKGRGFDFSEEKPDRFHGVSSFDCETGEFEKISTNSTYTSIFGNTMIDLAKKRKDIVAITAAMKLGTGLDKYSKEFPDRFIDVGIAEQLGVNIGAGMALSGMKPVVAIYSTFLQRGFDQLSQEVCLQDLPVLFAVDRAGLVGEDGATHHGYFDLTYLRALPNMVVMAPGDGDELEAMMRFGVDLKHPATIRFPRGCAGFLEPVGKAPIEMGKGEVLVEDGDLLIIAIGDMVAKALEIGGNLMKDGITASIVNARFVKPLDTDFYRRIAGGKKLIVTLENNVLCGGFGSAVMELLSGEEVEVPVISKGLPDRYINHGTIDELMNEIGLDASHLTEEIKERFRKVK
ncbi:MAG: 1-deoxy-D-xylulose-5-phosphate synthase [Actinobacteria bacterium]|nr:1-deoxy-D-xylulose-5-phosphate synthase [Actinomycetota bacterium]